MSDAEGFRSTRVTEIDLADPVPDIPAVDSATGRSDGHALVLVRLFSEPIGTVTVALEGDGATAATLAEQVRSGLGAKLAARLGVDSAGLSRALTDGAQPPADTYADRRARFLAAGPPHVTVVLCTRDRPAGLTRALAGLARAEYPSYDVLVVDNAPTTDAAAAVVDAARAGGLDVTRIVERRPGLSWARNLGARESRGALVAFMDDDEVPDAHWLAELAWGFEAGPRVGCVAGMILPAELASQAQDWFEQYGGHSKGRTDLEQVVFEGRARQHPLYPLPPFGAGGNMMFTKDCLATIRGFDVALGAGTPTHGAEDTAAFSDVLLAGYQLVNHPAGFVWHYHRADYDDLRAQLFGYGVGLSSYYVRALAKHPRATLSLLRIAPGALRDFFAPRGVRKQNISDLPPEVLRQHSRGLATGLVAYPRSVRRQRRVAAAFAQGADRG